MEAITVEPVIFMLYSENDGELELVSVSREMVSCIEEADYDSPHSSFRLIQISESMLKEFKALVDIISESHRDNPAAMESLLGKAVIEKSNKLYKLINK